jgi:hypothetical protein
VLHKAEETRWVCSTLFMLPLTFSNKKQKLRARPRVNNSAKDSDKKAYLTPESIYIHRKRVLAKAVTGGLICYVMRCIFRCIMHENALQKL